MMPPSVRIFVCVTPQDLRASFDGLAGLAAQLLGQDPQSGALFVFVNKRANRIKVVWREKNGMCMLYKRLHQALFRLPLRAAGDGATSLQINGRELAALLEGVVREKA
jgi:transposase